MENNEGCIYKNKETLNYEKMLATTRDVNYILKALLRMNIKVSQPYTPLAHII